MKKLYLGAFTGCAVLGTSAQEFLWQKDIQSSTRDFLSRPLQQLSIDNIFYEKKDSFKI